MTSRPPMVARDEGSGVRVAAPVEGITRITLDRPRAMNALDLAARDALAAAFAASAEDGEVRVVVLTGAGDRAFCAGADIREIVGLDSASLADVVRREHQLFHAIRTFPKPVVARINGYALGAGLLLAMVADIAVARRDAVLGLPEVIRGTAAGYETALLLPYVGLARARALALLGQSLTGEEAEIWGLVNRAEEADRLDGAVESVARRLAALEPAAVACQKRIVNLWLDADFPGAIAASIEEVCRLLEERDMTQAAGKPSLIGDPFMAEDAT